MNPPLHFNLNWEPGGSGTKEERLTHASLGIVADGKAITRVEDLLARTTRPVIRVSAYPLAVWLASNWWRLRWEVPTQEVRDDWSMVHQVAAAGGGYVWPDLKIVSHGDYINLYSHETSSIGGESIAYLGEMNYSLSAEDFVDAVDDFIETVLARLVNCGLDDTVLHKLWALIQEERRDSAVREYRRLEALLGFDSEKGPPSQIDALIEMGARLGAEAVAEVAASSAGASELEETEEALQQADQMVIADFASLRANLMPNDAFRYPWQYGQAAACRIRQAIGHPEGPLEDAMLEEWLSLSENVLAGKPDRNMPFAAALRDGADAGEIRVLFRSNWPSGRRFEVARLLGDHLVSAPIEDRLMPATNAKTARQSTQRAFAAEFLLPLDDLRAHIGPVPEDEDRIEDIASEYGVSPLLVRRRLEDNGLLNLSI